jgi:hypothetical protein
MTIFLPSFRNLYIISSLSHINYQTTSSESSNIYWSSKWHISVIFDQNKRFSAFQRRGRSSPVEAKRPRTKTELIRRVKDSIKHCSSGNLHQKCIKYVSLQCFIKVFHIIVSLFRTIFKYLLRDVTYFF